MYRRTIRIGLFGVPDTIGNALESATPFDRFVHEVAHRPAFDAETFFLCDVAIIDAHNFMKTYACTIAEEASFLPSRDLPKLVAHRRELRGDRFGAIIIVADHQTSSTWTADDYALVDAVWSPTIPAERVTFDFRQLQRAALQNAELYLARAYLNTSTNSSPQLIWFKDAKGAHLKVNDAFCATVEKTKEQIEGRGHYYIWDITPEEYASGEFVCLESETETMESGRTCLFDEQVKTKRGMRQFKTYKSPLFDEDGRIMGTVGIGHDVTDLDNIATELDILINAVPFAALIEDIDGTVLNANRTTEEFFGVPRGQIIGERIANLRRLVFGDKVAKQREAHENGEFTGLVNGVEKTFDMKKEPILDVFGNRTGDLRLYRDVTSERALENRVITAAHTDYLTGLYNRRYFYEYLEEHAENPPVAFALLDLDNFKTINDQYGHAVGDAALLKTSALLRETFPTCPVVRWGGDEFITIVFNDQPTSTIVTRTEALLERLKTESLEITSQPLTGSAGIAFADDSHLSIDELVKRSDIALYRAKHAGKSRCLVYEATEEQV